MDRFVRMYNVLYIQMVWPHIYHNAIDSNAEDLCLWFSYFQSPKTNNNEKRIDNHLFVKWVQGLVCSDFYGFWSIFFGGYFIHANYYLYLLAGMKKVRCVGNEKKFQKISGKIHQKISLFMFYFCSVTNCKSTMSGQSFIAIAFCMNIILVVKRKFTELYVSDPNVWSQGKKFS